MISRDGTLVWMRFLSFSCLLHPIWFARSGHTPTHTQKHTHRQTDFRCGVLSVSVVRCGSLPYRPVSGIYLSSLYRSPTRARARLHPKMTFSLERVAFKSYSIRFNSICLSLSLSLAYSLTFLPDATTTNTNTNTSTSCVGCVGREE